MKKSGIVKEVGSDQDLSNLSCYDLRQAVDRLIRLCQNDPNIFIEKPFEGPIP